MIQFKHIIFIGLLLFSCKKSVPAHTETVPALTAQFSIVGSKIYHYNDAVQIFGANTFHIFGAGGSDLNSWHLDAAREFIGNVQEAHLTGDPFQDSNGSYLHSMQAVADSNRANNRITIFCPFQWNGLPATDFTGTMPAQTYWWSEYKIKLADWAAQFKGQPDVWLEVWNEPYRFDGSDGYTDDIWLHDMNELVSIIRSRGNNNVILVPCAQQGQDETVLNNRGAAFIAGKTNILFDIHAYEKWLLVSPGSFGARLSKLRANNLPVFFGETAPLNAGTLMNPQPFLDSAYNRGLSVCAWAWKYDDTDPDALLDSQGAPNNMNNNNWGSVFRTFSLQPRRP